MYTTITQIGGAGASSSFGRIEPIDWDYVGNGMIMGYCSKHAYPFGAPIYGGFLQNAASGNPALIKNATSSALGSGTGAFQSDGSIHLTSGSMVIETKGTSTNIQLGEHGMIWVGKLTTPSTGANPKYVAWAGDTGNQRQFFDIAISNVSGSPELRFGNSYLNPTGGTSTGVNVPYSGWEQYTVLVIWKNTNFLQAYINNVSMGVQTPMSAGTGSWGTNAVLGVGSTADIAFTDRETVDQYFRFGALYNNLDGFLQAQRYLTKQLGITFI